MVLISSVISVSRALWSLQLRKIWVGGGIQPTRCTCGLDWINSRPNSIYIPIHHVMTWHNTWHIHVGAYFPALSLCSDARKYICQYILRHWFEQTNCIWLIRLFDCSIRVIRYKIGWTNFWKPQKLPLGYNAVSLPVLKPQCTNRRICAKSIHITDQNCYALKLLVCPLITLIDWFTSWCKAYYPLPALMVWLYTCGIVHYIIAF